MSNLNGLFKKELKAINMGLDSFYKDLESQDVKTVSVAWRPKAGGNKKMSSMLSRLKSKK